MGYESFLQAEQVAVAIVEFHLHFAQLSGQATNIQSFDMDNNNCNRPISIKYDKCRGVAMGWTGVDMSTLLLPEVVPEIDELERTLRLVQTSTARLMLSARYTGAVYNGLHITV